MAEKRIILHQYIIDKVKSVYVSSNDGKTFSIDSLIDDLRIFAEKEKELIGMNLYKQYFLNGPEERTLQYALKRESDKNIKDCGATSPLRNLLCFYAFRINYTDTLKQLGLHEKKIEAESDKIKNGGRKVESTLIENALMSMEIKMQIVLQSFQEELYNRLSNRYDKKQVSIKEIRKKIQNDDLEGAKNLLIKSLTKHSHNATKENYSASEDAFELAIIFQMKSEYGMALEYINKAIECRENFYDAWMLKSRILFYLNETGDALAAIQYVINLDKKSYIAWEIKGSIHAFLGQYMNAERALKESIRIKPNYALAWYKKGIMKYEQYIESNNKKYLGVAIRLFYKATEMKKDFSLAWYKIGFISLMENFGSESKAIDAIKKGEKYSKDSSKAWDYIRYSVFWG